MTSQCHYCNPVAYLEFKEGYLRGWIPSPPWRWSIFVNWHVNFDVPESKIVQIFSTKGHGSFLLQNITSIWRTISYSETVSTHCDNGFCYIKLRRSIQQNIKTRFYRNATTRRPAICSTCVFWSSKKAIDPTFTKFSGIVGEVKG